jgi:Flp pilus assembly protein TadD
VTSADNRFAWLLVAVGIAIYANSLPNPFVFDDIPAIVDNYHIRQLWPLSESLTAPPQVTVAGRPLVSFSLALNHALGADVPRDLAGRAPGFAFAVALLWLVHPLNSEVVNYVVQRTESIMALCYLLTFYCAIRAAAPGARRGAWSAAAVLACALGMFSKESMVSAPLALLLYDVAFGHGTPRERLAQRRGLYLGLAGCWLLLGAILWSGPRSETVGFAVGITAFDYLLNQGVIVFDYLKSAAVPYPLVFDYGDARPIALAEALPGVLFVGATGIAALVAYLRRPPAGFAGLWIFVTLAPTSSLVPIASEVGAERRMYLPLAGVLVIVVASLVRLLDRSGWEGRRRARAAIGLLLVGATLLGAVTVRRNLDYRTHERIWRTAVAARPLNPRAHVNLGHALHVAGRDAEAVASYERALEIDPGYAQAHFNLGVLLAEQGDRDGAVARYRRALELNPDLTEVHHNLAAELGNRGELPEAIVHFREAVRLSPESVASRLHLARALRLTDRSGEALEQLEAALRFDARHVETLGELAWLLATDRDPALRDGGRAVELARRAIDLGEGGALAYDTLAAALAEQGRFDEAETAAGEARSRATRPGLVQQIELRLEGYRAGRPHRE